VSAARWTRWSSVCMRCSDRLFIAPPHPINIHQHQLGTHMGHVTSCTGIIVHRAHPMSARTSPCRYRHALCGHRGHAACTRHVHPHCTHTIGHTASPPQPSSSILPLGGWLACGPRAIAPPCRRVRRSSLQIGSRSWLIWPWLIWPWLIWPLLICPWPSWPWLLLVLAGWRHRWRHRGVVRGGNVAQEARQRRVRSLPELAE